MPRPRSAALAFELQFLGAKVQQQSDLANLLTYFTRRITNAALEGLSHRSAGSVKKAFDYRNRERFKTDILIHLGAPGLYPSQ